MYEDDIIIIKDGGLIKSLSDEAIESGIGVNQSLEKISFSDRELYKIYTRLIYDFIQVSDNEIEFGINSHRFIRTK